MSDILTITLKILPLVFNLVLDLFPRDFEKVWGSQSDSYFSKVHGDLEDIRSEVEWMYRNISLHTGDLIQVKYSIGLSLIYFSFLILLKGYQFRSWWFLIPFVGFILYFIAIQHLIDKMYSISNKGRNPDRYYTHYYKKENKKTVKDAYVGLLGYERDRMLSPVNYNYITQAILITTVAAVELSSKDTALISSIAALLMIATLGYLMTPGDLDFFIK